MNEGCYHITLVDVYDDNILVYGYKYYLCTQLCTFNVTNIILNYYKMSHNILYIHIY